MNEIISKPFGTALVEHGKKHNDVDAITAACKKAQSSDKPVAILCRTKPWTGFTFLKKRWDDKKLHFIRLTESEREGLEKEIAAS